MEAVLDGPVIADEGADVDGHEGQRGDIEAAFALDLVAGLAGALDDDEARQAGPLVTLLQPADVVNDGDGAGLDAAVVAVDALVPADGGVLEVIGFLLVGEQLDVLAQRALIALQGEDVVGLLVQDFLGDGALADPMRRWIAIRAVTK